LILFVRVGTIFLFDFVGACWQVLAATDKPDHSRGGLDLIWFVCCCAISFGLFDFVRACWQVLTATKKPDTSRGGLDLI
jgi:hypothetical protein